MSSIERIDGESGRIALLGVAATRRIEGEALAALPPFTLMARAGEAVARLAIALAPHARRIVVFAGPGNNGGDGIEAATRLCAWGKATTVLRVGVAATLPSDAGQALARAREAGVDIGDFDADEVVGANRPDLVIDALLGIGASRPPKARSLRRSAASRSSRRAAPASSPSTCRRGSTSIAASRSARLASAPTTRSR